MSKTYGMGIIGCGDYLRWESEAISQSKMITVKSLFDMDSARAEKYAKQLGGEAVGTAEEIINDPAIDIVCIFVPPWARKDLLVSAARAGKHIIATKPLAPNVSDCQAMVDAVQSAGVRCGVFYLRTGSPSIETFKKVLDSGELGRLALVRHDWIHHYPQWNNWALDPDRNGGPFMDAEIHILNFTRYLMGRPATHCTFFSHNLAHPDLTCADTEGMTVEFADGGLAYLFITWAADLKVDSLEGNYRESIDVNYYVTDQGWRVTFTEDKVVASRAGETREFPFEKLPATTYDRFAAGIESGELPSDIVSIETALEDIRIIRTGSENPGLRMSFN